MYFLIFNWLSNVADNAQGTVISMLRSLFYAIDIIIYKLIINVYNLFTVLCHIKVMDSGDVEKIATRIGLLLGIIMFFYIAFSFIKMMLDPDTITDKNKGAINIVKKVIIVLVLLGSSNLIFKVTDEIQDFVLDSRVIEETILPWKVNSDNFGGFFAARLLSAFYTMDERASGDSSGKYDSCKTYAEMNAGSIARDGIFDYGYVCLNEHVSTTDTGEALDIYVIDFNWFLSAVVGIVVVWMLFMYCISIGMRSIQLAILQIISPVAIISYLSPKQDTMLSKWAKKYVATYIDLFIRIAIVNIVVYLIATILSGMDSGSTSSIWQSLDGVPGFTDKMRPFISIVMIIALLSFGKKAPELLKDLMPASASGLSYGISAKDRPGLGMFAKAAGVAAGGAVAMGASSAIGGASYFNSRRKKLGAFDKKSKAEYDAMSDDDKKKYRNSLMDRRAKMALSTMSGVLTGAGRGLVGGARKGNVFKNVKGAFDNQLKANDVYDNLILSGGTPSGKLFSKINNVLGETKGQEYQRKLNDLDKLDEFYSSMKKAADEIADVKAAKDAWEHVVQEPGEELQHYMDRKSTAYNYYKALQKRAMSIAIDGTAKIGDSYETYYEDAKGNKQKIQLHIKDKDDIIQVSDVKAFQTQADSYSISHSVQYYDSSNDTWKDVGELKELKALSNVSDNAHKTKTAITSRDDYAAALANDKAAGVDSNKNNGNK